MNWTTKLIKKIKSTGSIGKIVLIVLLAIAVLIGLFMLGGLILVWGLNLMGISIPYTLKSIIGASIVIICLKPASFGSKEK